MTNNWVVAELMSGRGNRKLTRSAENHCEVENAPKKAQGARLKAFEETQIEK